MKKELLLAATLMIVSGLSACNYNHDNRETSPYRGGIAFQHADETVVRPKTKTMFVTRQITHIDDDGNRHEEEVTESVTVPVDISNADDIERAQHAIRPNQNRIQIDVNKSYEYR